MVSPMQWKDALLQVYEAAGEPLDAKQAVERIVALGLRDLSNAATPERTANRDLNAMARQVGTPIKRVDPGVFQYDDPEDPDLDTPGDAADDGVDVKEDLQRINVSACGLYWEKDSINWGRGCRILGQNVGGSAAIDFSEQQGIYILYRGTSVVYVGRATTGNLRDRLKYHASVKTRSFRWDRFSWFGFRPVDDEGVLGELPKEIKAEDLIGVLETALIEALEPPLNAKFGDHMGEHFAQFVDQEELTRQGISSLQAVINRARDNL